MDKWWVEITQFVLTLLGLSSDSSDELDAVEQYGVVNKSDDPSSNIDEVEQPDDDELSVDEVLVVFNDINSLFLGWKSWPDKPMPTIEKSEL